jgi:hypothetical protein
MEVEEGEGAHGQVQVGEAAAGWSGGRRGEQQVRTWPPAAAAAGQGGCRWQQHLVQRPSSVPPLANHAPLHQ